MDGASAGTRVALPPGTELKITGCKVAEGRDTGVPLSSVEVLVGVGVSVTGSGAVGAAGGSGGVAIGDWKLLPGNGLAGTWPVGVATTGRGRGLGVALATGGGGVALGGRGVSVGRGVLVYWRVAVGCSGIVAVGSTGVSVLVGVSVSVGVAVAVTVAVAVAVRVDASAGNDCRLSPAACRTAPLVPAFSREANINTTT